MGDLVYLLRQARDRPVGFLLRRLGTGVARAWRTAAVTLGTVPYASNLRGQSERSRQRLFAPAGIDRMLELLERHRPDELKALLRRADALAAGELTVLGHTLDVRDGVDWHQDFVSGCRWPVRFHTRYRYADLVDSERSSDVKIPWELGRLQALPPLALAFRYSGERRYIETAEFLLEDWRDACPVGYGIVWTVGMEVALRAVSVVLFCQLLAGAGGRGACVDLRPWLAAHGRFLARNLEYSDVAGNHYASCLLGLLVLALHVPEESEAERWLQIALRELRRQMPHQTYPDGVCHEGSVAYHRLVLEIFFHADRLARVGNLDLGVEFATRLQAMLEVVRGWLKPDGRAPVWGDNDDGRVVCLSGSPTVDHRYLLIAGAARFRRRDLWPHALPGVPAPSLLDALMLLREDDLPVLEDLLKREEGTTSRNPPDPVAFPAGGFYILRRGEAYCLIDCGDVGLRGRGGHGHNDALSVELVLAGLDVLTDTGCASYTRSRLHRLESISARSHNAPVVNGREPAPVALTRLPHATAYPVSVLEWRPDEGVFVGMHGGYRTRGEAGDVRRKVTLSTAGDRLRIEDLVHAAPTDRTSHTMDVEWNFHLAPRWRWEASETTPAGVEFVDESGNRLLLQADADGGRAVEMEVGKSRHYPSYDHPVERLRVTLRRRGRLPGWGLFEFLVVPVCPA